MKPAKTMKRRREPSRPKTTQPQDPVEVYCRIRPVVNPNDVPVVGAIDNRVVQLQEWNDQPRNPPKQYQYTFSYVFDTNACQKEVFDHVGLPLVSDLVHGKSGLLFTYGITSSGKTYTMSGNPQDGGILPRCLDVVFNSIGEYQARKYVFRPDKLNGFHIQTVAEALAQVQQEAVPMTPKAPKIRRRDDNGVEWAARAHETGKVEGVAHGMAYAVFVSYFELYNNQIYDLLDENSIDTKTRHLRSKILREDSKRCVYVSGVTEAEVKSTNEAYEAWCRGQKSRHVAHTALNAESSRSHSVFNIRLVRAPLDAHGLDVIQDKRALVISQLSLVDLAGSERTGRTGNTGHRLREAGNINNSLMVLRACMEALRENQTTGSNKVIPYRDTKMTHLFKNFFDGEGKVRMIVCLNPRPDDYDETFHVMKFAEMAQEVLIPSSTAQSAALHLRAGRRRPILPRAAKFRGSLKERSTMPPPEPPREVSCMPLSDCSDSDVLQQKDEQLKANNAARNDDLKRKLIQKEAEHGVLKEEHKLLRMDLKAREQQVFLLEKKLANAEQTVQALTLELEGMAQQKRTVEKMLEEKQRLLEKEALQKVQMQLERERMKSAMAEAEAKLSMANEKLRILRDVLNSDNWYMPPAASAGHPLLAAPPPPQGTMGSLGQPAAPALAAASCCLPPPAGGLRQERGT